MFSRVMDRTGLARLWEMFDLALRARSIVRAQAAEIDLLRSRIDLGPDVPAQFQADSEMPEYLEAYSKPEPLVSICIASYNRGRMLAERSVPSLLGQTYKNIEVVVVGDCCTDDTAERMAAIGDPRLRFVNLPEWGPYPEDPHTRWLVQATKPHNHALDLARGDFISHLDDDDEHPPERVERLVRFIQQTRADVVWHDFWWERDGRWVYHRAPLFRSNHVTTSSVFYHRWFRRIRWDINGHVWNEVGDWNRFRKFLYVGARVAHFGEPLLRHYQERTRVTGARSGLA